MAKRELNPTTALYPVPTVLVTCQRVGEQPNIITIAWTGTVCSEPPMLSIAVRPGRYSHAIIMETGEFVVNIPHEDILRATDLCGVVSGRDEDKFELAGFTTQPATKVVPPLIAECPVSIECKTRQIMTLGTHDLFVAEILVYHVEEDLLDEQGRPRFESARPVSYCHGEYWNLGAKIGTYGFSKGKLQ